ncbi:MAG TPA: hypothetical protein VN442_02325 [Bryobacteraceae bacterium]|nr:hypothetical protein [Bryobacteraceae bacterium]
MKPIAFVAVCLSVACALPAADITVADDQAVLKSNSIERVIRFGDGNVRTTSLTVAGQQMLAAPAREFSIVITREQANRRPRGLRPEDDEQNAFTQGHRSRWRGDAYDPARYDDLRPDAPKWVDARPLEASSWRRQGGKPTATVTKPAPGVTRLSIHTALAGNSMLEGVGVELNYEVYEGYPVVRKWAVVRNGGSLWLKLERMMVDDLHLVSLTRRSLAAAMFGVQPSVVAFEGPGARYGMIAASEIPSALRTISEQGAMGYTPNLFEWVLGPGEEFSSEPVFYYGYSGPAIRTVSSVSTPLDRTLEGPYIDFVDRHIGVAASSAPIHGPQWMTWAYFYHRIDDKLVRELADIAARSGFTEMLLDDGWQKGRLGVDVDTAKFPDFAATAEFVRSKGLALGLWVSCFRDRDSRDLAAMPDARILPSLIRSPSLPGLAMSFASGWRDFYVKDLVEVARRYGISYFKQDFTNVMYGDLAEGHEGRTRKESLLRGLRGLLAAQAALRRVAPDVVNEITHEIYWGTPGVPADLAALKHTARFHIPPNEAIGSDVKAEFHGREITAEEHAAALREGCWLARQRFYSHRGLPLYPLEFYAASTTNHLGSLSALVQDRQVASWLMGMPVCFSGDARTLTGENIAHYRKRLEAVRRLDKACGIYKRFQFSGVPEPTDVDWHWWGKLNARGHGAVVVLRGSAGSATRTINIPWVRRDAQYRVTGLFSGKSYGPFSGQVLQDGGLRIDLPVYGQELLEIAP